MKNQWFCEIYNSQKLAGQVIADGHCSFRARSIWVPYITLFFSKNILKEWIFKEKYISRCAKDLFLENIIKQFLIITISCPSKSKKVIDIFRWQVIADGHCSFGARSIWVPYITLFFRKKILKEWIFWRKIHLKMCKSTDSWKHYKTIFNYNHFPGLQRAEKSLIFLSPFAGLSALHVGRTYISCNQFLFSSF